MNRKTKHLITVTLYIINFYPYKRKKTVQNPQNMYIYLYNNIGIPRYIFFWILVCFFFFNINRNSSDCD